MKEGYRKPCQGSAREETAYPSAPGAYQYASKRLPQVCSYSQLCSRAQGPGHAELHSHPPGKACRELHRMCAEDNQLKLLRKDVKRLGTFALKQLRDMEQEKSDLEVQVVNGMVKLDAQQKLLREEYNEKVHQQRLQVVGIQKDISQDSRAWEDSRLDNLMDRLSILNTNLKLQTEPQDEITLDDVKADLSKTRCLDQMLKEEKSPASAFHGSWSAIGTGDDDQMLEEDNSACAFHGSWSATGRWM